MIPECAELSITSPFRIDWTLTQCLRRAVFGETVEERVHAAYVFELLTEQASE